MRTVDDAVRIERNVDGASLDGHAGPTPFLGRLDSVAALAYSTKLMLGLGYASP